MLTAVVVTWQTLVVAMSTLAVVTPTHAAADFFSHHEGLGAQALTPFLQELCA